MREKKLNQINEKMDIQVQEKIHLLERWLHCKFLTLTHAYQMALCHTNANKLKKNKRREIISGQERCEWFKRKEIEKLIDA